MKELDLKTLTVVGLGGVTQEVEFAKNLAQIIFQQTQSIVEHDLSLTLYRDGKIEDTPENRDIVISYTEKGFLAFIQVALKQKLDENN